jgi:seryl-tRNA synthetase
MSDQSDQRARQLEALETDAEVLVAHQLDLVAQLEKQLRAVHHTMRRIEQLRAAKRRRGGSATLSNGARDNTLDHLSAELTSIDTELDTQHELCLEMQTTVEKMRARLRAMRHASIPPPPSDDPGSSPQPSG